MFKFKDYYFLGNINYGKSSLHRSYSTKVTSKKVIIIFIYPITKLLRHVFLWKYNSNK